ncbi:SRPBCC domain-containing protein [Streptomyces sp. NPDC002276]
MSVDLTGTWLALGDGRPAVRFSRVYDQPLDRVWQFVTDPDELAQWFPSRAEFELRPGGTATFSGRCASLYWARRPEASESRDRTPVPVCPGRRSTTGTWRPGLSPALPCRAWTDVSRSRPDRHVICRRTSSCSRPPVSANSWAGGPC